MGFGAPMHWILILLVILLLFGSGRLSSLMGDMAKGIKSFKKGMADDDDPPRPPPRIEAPTDVGAAAERDSERVRDDRA
jgi:sec-independent protein translocase protein TatA